MNTSEGILIEDGELTIHVRRATKVGDTLVYRLYTLFKSYSQKPRIETTTQSQAQPAEISSVFTASTKYESIQAELLKIELLKKFGGENCADKHM